MPEGKFWLTNVLQIGPCFAANGAHLLVCGYIYLHLQFYMTLFWKCFGVDWHKYMCIAGKSQVSPFRDSILLGKSGWWLNLNHWCINRQLTCNFSVYLDRLYTCCIIDIMVDSVLLWLQYIDCLPYNTKAWNPISIC